MKTILSKLAFVALACILIVSTFAVVGPRAVQAVVATLIRDVDNAARNRVTMACGVNDGSFSKYSTSARRIESIGSTKNDVAAPYTDVSSCTVAVVKILVGVP